MHRMDQHGLRADPMPDLLGVPTTPATSPCVFG